jgi:hypothetical protein
VLQLSAAGERPGLLAAHPVQVDREARLAVRARARRVLRVRAPAVLLARVDRAQVAVARPGRPRARALLPVWAERPPVQARLAAVVVQLVAAHRRC